MIGCPGACGPSVGDPSTIAASRRGKPSIRGSTDAGAAAPADPGEPGSTDVRGISSAVQAAVPFFPPTDFLQMDAWYVEHPEVVSFIVIL